MVEELQFTIAGNKVQLSKRVVESAMRNVSPDKISRYSVRISNTDYPIKQVVSVATGIPAIAFISTTAYRVLTHLGFSVKT
jgi:hypothetical protein